MIQKTIRPYGGVQFTVVEGAELIEELNDRTESSQLGYNSMDELATKVKDSEVVLKQISPFLVYNHKNLFDKSAVVFDKYVDAISGQVLDISNGIVSDFIPVDSSNQYVITSDLDLDLSGFMSVTFLASDKTTSVAKSIFVGSGSPTNTNCSVDWFDNGWKITSFPATAEYLVFQVRKNDTSTIWENAKIQMEIGLVRTEYDDRSSFVTAVRGAEIQQQNELEFLDLSNRISNIGESRWTNKIYSSFGDSITWYDTNGRIGYQTYIRDVINFSSYTNNGINGGTAATTIYDQQLVTKLANYDFTSFDVITIALGTNDYGLDVPIGLETSVLPTDYYGAFNTILDYIFDENPEIRVILMTPLQRVSMGANGAGHKLSDYADALKIIGKKYGCPVIDCYGNSGFNAKTLATYTDDGLHPVNLGFEFMGKYVASQFKNL